MKRVSVGVLPNGFRYYTQFDSRHHVSGIGLKIGSVHNPPGQTGMQHLVEHFIGDYGEENEQKLEEYNCGPDESINIRVDNSSTFYGHDLVYLPEMAEDIFRMAVENILNPNFTEDALGREVAAVVNEWALRGKDVLETDIHTLIGQAMYEKNPVGRRLDCEPDEIRSVTLVDIQRFYDSYYGANNAFAIILNKPYQKVKRQMERLFGDWRTVPAPRPACDPADIRPVLTGIRSLEIERRGIHQYHVVVGFPTEPYGSKDDVAIDLLARVWEQRMRFVLRDGNTDPRKGAYRVFAHTDRSFLHGMIYLWFATTDGDYAKYGEEAILKECARLRSDWADKDLFIRMWNKLHNAHMEAFSSESGTLAERIIQAACNGDEDMRGLNSYLGSLRDVTRGTVCRAAEKYFIPPNYVRVVIRPADDLPPERVSFTVRPVPEVPPEPESPSSDTGTPVPETATSEPSPKAATA